MKITVRRITTTVVTILFVACSIACAGTKPQVTRADGVFMDTGASFRIQWQSAEPVVRVHISVGGERKTVDVDIRDNRRHPDGYSGDATALVPLTGTGAVSAYTVQVEDEFRQKSDVLNGVLAGNRPNFPPGMQPDDGWGQHNLTPPTAGAPGAMQPQGVFPPQVSPGMMPPSGMIMPPPQPGMMPPPQPGMMIPPPPPVMPVDPGAIPLPPPPPPPA